MNAKPKSLAIWVAIAVLTTAMVACATKGDGSSTPAGFVDLGLPSGLLWAECNLGATAPKGYGNYYAWGETALDTTYTWETYRYCNDGYNTMTKYCNNADYGYNGFTDALTTLQAMDDAATAALGDASRIPTKAEWEELMNTTTATWTTLNGVYGRLFTAPNGNSLFLPAAGFRHGLELFNDGIYGSYWSSSLHESNPNEAWSFNFNTNSHYLGNDDRSFGGSIRAVHAK